MKKTVDWSVNQGITRMTLGLKRSQDSSTSIYLSLQRALLPLQEASAAVRSACAMRTLVLLLVALFVSVGLVSGEITTPQNVPIEITSTGETTYENGLATARDNVAIHIGNTDIYADYAQYNSTTHDMDLRGHVRIYRDTSLYAAESGVYNTETKKIRTTNGRTESQPYFLTGANVTSISENGYIIHNGTFTTHNWAKPDFHLHSRKIRINDKYRLILQYVTAYVAKVPVFCCLYLYQSLTDTFSVTISPAYTSTSGASLR